MYNVSKNLIYVSSLKRLIFLSLLAFGCTRPGADKLTSVTISLPNANSSLASSGTIRKSSDTVTAQGASFGVSTPTAYSTLDCFFVFVSGPESGMSSSQCTVGSSNLPVGVVTGGLSAGTTVTLDVPSGDGRIISLIGIKTDGTIACPGLDNFDAMASHFSNPVVAGSSAPLNLSPGATVDVNLPVSSTISSNQVIANCTGPAFNKFGNGGGGGVPAGYAVIAQDKGTAFIGGSCVPMQLRIVDAGGNGAGVSGSYTAVLNGLSGVLLSNNQNCGSATSSISLTYSSYNTQSFYALIPPSPSNYQFAVTVSSGPVILPNGTIPTVFTSVADPGGAYSLSFVDAWDLSTTGSTPAATPANYVCRQYLVQVQDSLHRPVPSPVAGVSANSITASGSNFLFYSDPFCATSATGSTFSFGSNASLTNLSVYGTVVAPSPTPVVMAPSMPGATPTISNGFTFNTTATPGTAVKLGLLNPNDSFFGGNSISMRRPGSGCSVGAELGYFDAANQRTVVPGSGNFTFSGFGGGIIYSNSSQSPSVDLGGSGSTLSGITPGNTVNAYKVPIYVCSSSPTGAYTMSVSGLLSGTFSFTVDP